MADCLYCSWLPEGCFKPIKNQSFQNKQDNDRDVLLLIQQALVEILLWPKVFPKIDSRSFGPVVGGSETHWFNINIWVQWVSFPLTTRSPRCWRIDHLSVVHAGGYCYTRYSKQQSLLRVSCGAATNTYFPIQFCRIALATVVPWKVG